MKEICTDTFAVKEKAQKCQHIKLKVYCMEAVTRHFKTCDSRKWIHQYLNNHLALAEANYNQQCTKAETLRSNRARWFKP